MHSEMMGEIGKYREQLNSAIIEYSKCTMHVTVGTGGLAPSCFEKVSRCGRTVICCWLRR